MHHYIPNVSTNTLDFAKVWAVCNMCPAQACVGWARPYPHVGENLGTGFTTIQVPQAHLDHALDCKGCGAATRGVVIVDAEALARDRQ